MLNIKSIWQKRHISLKKLYLKNGYYLDRSTFRIKRIRINLFILGAQKCATTSLHNYLSIHPEIFMSTPIKEPGYFIFHEHMEKNFIEKDINIKSLNNLLFKYMAQGYKGEKFFGDSSVHYTMGRRAEKFSIPKKIHSYNPHSKFIYVIRNPFERIVSAYNNYHFQNGSIDQEIYRDELLVETSKYYSQLALFSNYFSKESIKVILFEDLVQDKANVLNDIFGFLNLPPVSQLEAYAQYNKTDKKATNHFSEKSYKYLMNIFQSEILQLEKNYDISIAGKWDLSKETWTK